MEDYSDEASETIQTTTWVGSFPAIGEEGSGIAPDFSWHGEPMVESEMNMLGTSGNQGDILAAREAFGSLPLTGWEPAALGSLYVDSVWGTSGVREAGTVVQARAYPANGPGPNYNDYNTLVIDPDTGASYYPEAEEKVVNDSEVVVTASNGSYSHWNAGDMEVRLARSSASDLSRQVEITLLKIVKRNGVIEAVVPAHFIILPDQIYSQTVSLNASAENANKSASESLTPMEFKMAWETKNKANQVFNPTRKDDSSGTFPVEEDGNDTYAAPRNNLYVVADPSDGKVRITVDVGLGSPRDKFIAAAFNAGAHVTGSDKALPAAADQPVDMEIPVSGENAQELEINVGFDANGNGTLEATEALRMEVYKHKPDNQPRYLTVKAISDAKYETHRQKLENRITAWGNQSSPSGPLETARSFVALFFYNGDTTKLQTRLQPSTVADAQLDAFATGTGFSEWLTHNSGATFTDQGTATIKNYTWREQTEVAEFFAKRTPFALERPVVVGDGLQFDLTSTGKELKAFYEAEVKSTAETALASQVDGTSVTLPASGWYEFPNTTYPNIFKSESPALWNKPSTSTVIVGENDGYSGLGGLFGMTLSSLTYPEALDEYDAFGSVGRGRIIQPRYRFTVTKEKRWIWPVTWTEYAVTAVQFQCAIEDLYDFNYEDGDLPSHAAAMQVGFGNGDYGLSREHGRIYRHRINILHTYGDHPFDIHR